MATRIGDMERGDRGKIIRLLPGDRGYRQKLLAMGLTPGTEFSVVRLAPLGDPVELNVRGASVSLRKGEADMLDVERV